MGGSARAESDLWIRLLLLAQPEHEVLRRPRQLHVVLLFIPEQECHVARAYAVLWTAKAGWWLKRRGLAKRSCGPAAAIGAAATCKCFVVRSVLEESGRVLSTRALWGLLSFHCCDVVFMGPQAMRHRNPACSGGLNVPNVQVFSIRPPTTSSPNHK